MASPKFEDDLTAVISADTSDFMSGMKQVEAKARDTGKVLDKNTLTKLRLDKAEFQYKLDEARKDLREAKEDGDKNAIIRLQIKTDSLKTELTEAGRRLQNYQNTGDVSLSRLQAKFNQTNKIIQGQGSIISGVNRILGTLGVSLGTYFSAQKVIELSDSFTNLNNRLKQVADGDSLDTLRGKIFDAANSARADVETYASAFARFDMVNKQLGGSQEETLLIMDSLAKGLGATGAEASEVNSVMLQLSQAFGSGRLSGDEFRSVAENMPGLLDILAKNLGVARGELKDMAAEGLITSKVLKDALIGANEQLNESFQKSSVTIGQAMTNATNDFIKKFGELDKTYSITEKTTEGINFISDALIFLLGWIIKIGTGWSFIFAKLANVTIGTGILIKGAFQEIGTFISSVFEFVSKNSFVLGENIGRAFRMIPEALGTALDNGIEKIEKFLNTASNGINNFAKKLGFEGNVVGEVKLGRIGGSKSDLQAGFKQFEKFSLDANKAVTANIKRDLEIQEDALNSFVDRIYKTGEEKIGNLRGTTQGGTTSSNIGGDTRGGEGSGKSKVDDTKLTAEEIKKIQDAEYEAEFKRQLKRTEWLKKQEEEKQDKLEETADKAKELYEKATKDFEKQIDISKDKIDEFTDKIKDAVDEISKIDEELGKLDTKRSTTLGERNVEIEKELEKLRADGSQDVLQIQKLLEEQKLIKQNATIDELKEAKRISELSITAKFLEELAAEKKALEDKKILKQQEIADLETQKLGELAVLNEYTAQKEAMDVRYKNKMFELQEQMTIKVREEVQKQNEEYDKMLRKIQAVAEAKRNLLGSTSDNLVASSAPKNSTITNTNAPVINQVVNATVNNNVDIDNIANQLAKKVTLASKGIY